MQWPEVEVVCSKFILGPNFAYVWMANNESIEHKNTKLGKCCIIMKPLMNVLLKVIKGPAFLLILKNIEIALVEL